VRSVANLLRRFDIEVPEQMLRTRNVAAVLVTAEASPYLRPGGRFEVHVASLGDAASLRGGVLWMTPLSEGPDVTPVATAQGPLAVASNEGGRRAYAVETTGVLPSGGLLEQPLPVPDFRTAEVLQLQEPDVATAALIAAAVNAELGEGTATVEDPGSVRLTLGADSASSPAAKMARIGEIRVQPPRAALIIIDARAGTLVAGGDLRVGEAVVSHAGVTLAIAAAPTGAQGAPGDLRFEPGASVQDIAAALHGVAASPETVAAVFDALRRVGALAAQVVVR
jgi:flagellar P-ring protein precursor FlgI